ncbi:MAG: hypothetical protein KatS3mg132_308 [Limisphaera sp.]|nr:MAG: hypothetical protein KatS3mg132_308 [Limisphaera sp.]
MASLPPAPYIGSGMKIHTIHSSASCPASRKPGRARTRTGQGAECLAAVTAALIAGLASGCGRADDTAPSTAPPPVEPEAVALAQAAPTAGPEAAVPPQTPGPRSLMDEERLRKAFADAPAAFHVFLEEALGVARTGNRAEAIEQFQKLLRHPQLTPEQRAAVQETLARLQRGQP